MKLYAVVSVPLIALSATFSAYAHESNPAAPTAANATREVQEAADAAAAKDSAELEKPTEAEAMQAAIKHVNAEGRMIIKETEILAWGTFNEKQAYWPMKFRMIYKLEGSDKARKNEYAVKLSKDTDGKWNAETYYAWRTDFK